MMMPAKNTIKVYGENTFYHAYNRGHNRQAIFRHDHDYRTFLLLFRRYLEPGFRVKKFTSKGEEYFLEPNHVYEEVELLAYCLMPNHFHLLLRQKTLKGMPKLLLRLISNYATYYNKKYETEGSPFQGTYKAIIVSSGEQLLHLSRYLHLNPSEITRDWSSYPYSSYTSYVLRDVPPWLKPEAVLGNFRKNENYSSFVKDYSAAKEEEKIAELERIKDLLLD